MSTTNDRSPSEARFAVSSFFTWFAITASWWALAFAPLPVPPAWLAEARAVCFGTVPNGLPSSWGWIVLILAPLSLLSFLLAVWGRELAQGLGELALEWRGRAAIAAVIAVTAFAMVSVGGRVLASERLARAGILANESDPFPIDLAVTADPAPPLPLIDHQGRPFDLAALAGRPVFVTFAYGHCTTVCPTLVDTIRRAGAAYPGTPPPTVVVTLDPWRDTPGTLPKLAAAWQLDGLEAAHLLSGTVEQVVAAIDAWGVGFSRDTRTGEIAHPGMIFVLDGEGRIAYRLLNPPASWLVTAAMALEQ